MTRTRPRALVEFAYTEAARTYLRNLPPEHFMEANAQGFQRKVTLTSLDLVHAQQPEVQVFNEMLVQYVRGRQRRPGQVVADNMVAVWHEPLRVEESYDVPLQPVKPFWVLDYISKHMKRKDYDDNFGRYEKELKVPYYLLFNVHNGELALYHFRGKKYAAVRSNADRRLAIPELEIEVAVLDRWVRFWFRGELLPLVGELQRKLDDALLQIERLEKYLDEERQTRLAMEEELDRERGADTERIAARGKD